MLAFLALTACGTPAPKNFGGSWKPVNRFQDKPTEIPLSPTYTFYASPMDETLKTMLTRWSKDSGRSLSYQLAFDFTLYKPVSEIHTTDLSAAVTELNSIYAAQGVSVTATDRAIVVEQAGSATSTATPANAAPANSKPANPVSGK